ncbi:2-aminoethylphosphonate--pyruvate transaminase-like isoform X2 [Ptychodera flava]|uniref:2-aminoethylphosphonate--pyruvate transaminase-like isoform X2 n=1 Tax=Ptychodera flava TaxID=63121 RepID=UPI003969C2E2
MPKVEKKLFTPGPLGVSLTTRQAMLRDLGSRDGEFIDTVKFIRNKLLELAEVSAETYTCVLVQGSGTFSVEAVLSTTIPRKGGKILVIENGAYGKRICQAVKVLGVDLMHLSFPEDKKVDVQKVAKCLQSNVFTNVAIVHCETSSGTFNPVTEVGALVQKYNPDASYFVDAMSSFGAVPLDLLKSNVHYLVSSANKCIEGVPGFAYVIAQTDKLLQCKGEARSLSLDLVAQYEGLEKNGQFRFTPPTHVLLAFKQALIELEAEGGVQGRANRYKTNSAVLQDGMKKMGFRQLLDPSDQGYIITSYHYPNHPNFNFQEFYQRLNDKDQVIYPGKVTDANCFRIGNIGHLFTEDMECLLQCIRNVCDDMDIPLPLPQK